MSEFARVQSTDALKDLRVSLIKFADAVRSAMIDADSEIQRTSHWLQTEQRAHWQRQLRRLHERVEQCKAALRHKTMYKSPTGSKQSTVDEEKALAAAKRAYAEAEQKARNTKRWSRQFEQEVLNFRGEIQPAVRAAEAVVPEAVAQLDRMIESIDQYLALQAPGGAREPVEAMPEDISVARGGQVDEGREQADEAASPEGEPDDAEEAGDEGGEGREDQTPAGGQSGPASGR
jgi:hypothetical protein